MNQWRRLGLGLALSISACRSPRASTQSPAVEIAGTPSRASTAQSSDHGEPVRGGIGHTAMIDLVALSSDGTVALTRDQIGKTRFWPALDGRWTPRVFPIDGPQQFSIARRPNGSAVVAAVDSAGGAQFFETDAAGTIKPLGAITPFEPLFGVHVVAGGDYVVGVFRDHSLRLLDLSGHEQARYQSRSFRPTSVHLGSDSHYFVAIAPAQKTPHGVEFHRFEWADDAGSASIQRKGEPRVIVVQTPPSPTTFAVDPDARRIAMIDASHDKGWTLVLADLQTEAAEVQVSVPMRSHRTPGIGFVSRHEVLVSGTHGSLSWLVDVRDQSRRARPAGPSPVIENPSQAIAGGTWVMGVGTWLFVNQAAERSHRYLGYRSSLSQSATISTSGQWVAWAYAEAPVSIEPFDGSDGPRTTLPFNPSFDPTFIQFVDDEHIVAADKRGTVHLYRWRDGVVVDTRGVQGAVRSHRWEPERGLLMLDRHNGDINLLEVSAAGFKGPYIVADGMIRSGLLASKPSGPVLWTFDQEQRMRGYTLEELRADPSHAQILAKGSVLPSNTVAPFALDRHGRHYGVRWNGRAMELFVNASGVIKTAASITDDVREIVPSPSGERLIVVYQNGQGSLVVGYDTERLDEYWSVSFPTPDPQSRWSADSRYVIIVSNTGVMIVDALTGEPTRRHCGVEFAAVATLPVNAFHHQNQPSICSE